MGLIKRELALESFQLPALSCLLPHVTLYYSSRAIQNPWNPAFFSISRTMWLPAGTTRASMEQSIVAHTRLHSSHPIMGKSTDCYEEKPRAHGNKRRISTKTATRYHMNASKSDMCGKKDSQRSPRRATITLKLKLSLPLPFSLSLSRAPQSPHAPPRQFSP